MPNIKPFSKNQSPAGPRNAFPLKPPSQGQVKTTQSPFAYNLPASNAEVVAATKNQFPVKPPPPTPPTPFYYHHQSEQQEKAQQVAVVEHDKMEEEQESDISDTEIQLAKILNTFAKGKNRASDDLLSRSELDEINQAVPWGTEMRLKRLANENIRLISSEMVRYLLCHEFKVRGSRGNTYTVQIGPKLDCNCRDHKARGTHCKHILYILLKELKVVDMHNKVYLTLYPDDNILQDIFKKYHPTC